MDQTICRATGQMKEAMWKGVKTRRWSDKWLMKFKDFWSSPGSISGGVVDQTSSDDDLVAELDDFSKSMASLGMAGRPTSLVLEFQVS